MKTIKLKSFLNFIFLFLFTISFIKMDAVASVNLTNPSVYIIHAPAGSLVPDVVMDNSGVLHMVYCKNQNAYYIRSTDNGATFSAPVKVNSSGTVEWNMGERGPKLSVGSDGVIHVVWMDHWSTGVYVYARYSRSTNGGQSFENLKSVSSTYGVDGVTVAADGNNHVCVFWHTMVPNQSLVAEATWLHRAMSSNNGVSFSADTNLVINNHNGLACSMCMTRARFGIDGKVYLAFRSAEDSIRDFFVAKGNPTGNNFTAIRVNQDNWKINYCPMVGPEMEIGNGGRQFCAFMTDGHVYWTVSDSAVTQFNQHVATPLNEVDEIFPTAIENTSGQVLFLWQVGPMSVNDSATVKWAVYSSSGIYTGQQGTVGRTFSGTKATAFVGTDNNFYIVTNVDLITSVEETAREASLNVYPNPVTEQATIFYYSKDEKSVSAILLDAKGRKVKEELLKVNAGENKIKLNLHSVKAGTYLLMIDDGTRELSKKIILN